MKRKSTILSVLLIVAGVLPTAGAFDVSVADETERDEAVRTLPCTEAPAEPEWRVGYRLEGGGTLLGARTLTREHIEHGTVLLREHDCLATEHVLLPPTPESAAILTDGLVNPPQWTVLGIDGSSTRIAFPFLAVSSGHEMGGSGEPWLASGDLEPRLGACFPANVEDRKRLVLAVAGIDHELVMHVAARRTSAPPAAHHELLRSETVRAHVERDYRTIRAVESDPLMPPLAALSDPPTVVRASRMEAVIDGRPETLWFLYYQWGEEIESAWLVQLLARENGPALELLAEPGLSCRTCGVVRDLERTWGFLWADFLAAVDIDGDRTDELLLDAQSYEERGIWIVKLRNGRLAWARSVPEWE